MDQLKLNRATIPIQRSIVLDIFVQVKKDVFLANQRISQIKRIVLQQKFFKGLSTVHLICCRILEFVDAGNGFLACMRTMAELPLDCPRVNIAWIEENRRTRAALCSIQILSKYYLYSKYLKSNIK